MEAWSVRRACIRDLDRADEECDIDPMSRTPHQNRTPIPCRRTRSARRSYFVLFWIALVSLGCMRVNVEFYEHPETAEIDDSPSSDVFEEKAAFVGSGVLFVPSVKQLSSERHRDGWLDLYCKRRRVVTIEGISLRAEGKPTVTADLDQTHQLVSLPDRMYSMYHARSTFRLAELDGVDELLGESVRTSKKADREGADVVTFTVEYRVGDDGESETIDFELHRTSEKVWAWPT